MRTVFAQTEYDKGWKAYEAGQEFLPVSTKHWQQGWEAAQKFRNR